MIRRAATIADPGELGPLAKAALLVTDSAVLRSALVLAGDSAATPAARVFSLFVALTQIEPRADFAEGVGFGAVLSEDREARCGLAPNRRRVPPRVLTRLPPAAPWLVAQAAAAIARSSAEPSVRLFAACVHHSVDEVAAAPPVSVAGLVRDSAGRPIAGAEVLALGSGMLAKANTAGEFRLENLVAGPELLVARAIGFRPERFPVTIAVDDPLFVAVVLEVAPPQLEELRVTAHGRDYRGRLAQFARRMLSSPAPRSSFIGPEEIEAWGHFDFGNVFRRAGLRVSGNEIACPNGASLGSRGIAMYVYLDDALISAAPGFDLAALPVQWIAAIEVYRRVIEAPIQHQSIGAGCVVLFTTR